MAAQIIDGRQIAAQIREDVAARATVLRQRSKAPCLAAVLVGDDGGAESYAGSQAKHAESVGIDYRLVRLPTTASDHEIRTAVLSLNDDAAVSGLMVHLPMPKGIDGFAIQQLITADKDVEGVGATNLGLLAMGRDALAPCTAAAAFECLKSTGVEIAGKNAVVVGRSVIVGKPLAMLLIGANATVTQCHTKTRDMIAHTRQAEILFAAAGAPDLIGADHVSPGAIVIDVGTNRVAAADGSGKSRLVGDVQFEAVKNQASWITPVPGGVGPVTVAMLLSNTVAAAERRTASSVG